MANTLLDLRSTEDCSYGVPPAHMAAICRWGHAPRGGAPGLAPARSRETLSSREGATALERSSIGEALADGHVASPARPLHGVLC